MRRVHIQSTEYYRDILQLLPPCAWLEPHQAPEQHSVRPERRIAQNRQLTALLEICAGSHTS